MKKTFGILFIGSGRMAAALAAGLLKKKFPKSSISAFDVSAAASAKFAERTGIRGSKSLNDCVSAADIIILAVKPQNAADALKDVKPLAGDKILLSILAGTKIRALKDLSGCEKIVRVMPNMPALIGEGVSAYSHTDSLAPEDIGAVEKILGSVGSVYKVSEEMMDAVTGLSGSGPAFVFDFIEALANGGHDAGLPEDLALKMAVETVRGAAGLVAGTGEHPSVLRAQVVTPGGTTAHGLMVLEEIAFKSVVAHAIVAASKRSKELGK